MQHQQDGQVILWAKPHFEFQTGLTMDAINRLSYSAYEHHGQSGGSLPVSSFTPRYDDYLFGVRMGWILADPSDFVIYNCLTVHFAANQIIHAANETPN